MSAVLAALVVLVMLSVWVELTSLLDEEDDVAESLLLEGDGDVDADEDFMCWLLMTRLELLLLFRTSLGSG
jgi:hypothetical protein